MYENNILSNLLCNPFFALSNSRIFGKFKFYFMKTVNLSVYGNIKGDIKYCTVCLKSKNRVYTQMLRIHLFSILFSTIKTPWTLAALAPLGLLILKTLTNVL